MSVHGVLTPPSIGPQGPISASVMILHGWEDPTAPAAEVLAVAAEMTAAGADWQLHAYGHALHAFTAEGLNLPERGLGYNETAAKRSWKATADFLAETIGRAAERT